MIWVPYRDMPVLALFGGIITGIIAITLVRTLIKLLGFCDKQIVCVKRRRWDWRKAVSGLIIGVILVFFITLISDVARAMSFSGVDFWPALRRALTFDTVVWWNWGLPGLLSTTCFFSFHAWAGLGRNRSAH